MDLCEERGKEDSATEMEFVRSVHGYSLVDKKRNEEIRQKFGIQCFSAIVKDYRRETVCHLKGYQYQF